MSKVFLSYLNVKGLLLAVVYLSLSVFFVFFVPKTVPEKSDLETIRLSEDSLDLAYDKNANTSFFTGTYNNSELRTIKLTLEAGLKLYGTNEFFIQMKERPEYYELMIYKDTTIFNERYTIYQLADEKDVLISYDFSAQIIPDTQHQKLSQSKEKKSEGRNPGPVVYPEIQHKRPGPLFALPDLRLICYPDPVSDYYDSH